MATKKTGACSSAGKADTGLPAGKFPALQIVSKREGFRRAGMAFGKQPTLIKLSDLTLTQISWLKAEPQLTVTAVEVEDKAAAE